MVQRGRVNIKFDKKIKPFKALRVLTSSKGVKDTRRAESHTRPISLEIFKDIQGSKEKRLQEQIPFVYNGMESLIPFNTTLSNVKTIAGRGSKDVLKDTPRLVATHGGKPEEWSKRVGKTVSAAYEFDIHWYERNYIMYEPKIKRMKEG